MQSLPLATNAIPAAPASGTVGGEMPLLTRADPSVPGRALPSFEMVFDNGTPPKRDSPVPSEVEVTTDAAPAEDEGPDTDTTKRESQQAVGSERHAPTVRGGVQAIAKGSAQARVAPEQKTAPATSENPDHPRAAGTSLASEQNGPQQQTFTPTVKVAQHRSPENMMAEMPVAQRHGPTLSPPAEPEMSQGALPDQPKPSARRHSPSTAETLFGVLPASQGAHTRQPTAAIAASLPVETPAPAKIDPSPSVRHGGLSTPAHPAEAGTNATQATKLTTVPQHTTPPLAPIPTEAIAAHPAPAGAQTEEAVAAPNSKTPPTSVTMQGVVDAGHVLVQKAAPAPLTKPPLPPTRSAVDAMLFVSAQTPLSATTAALPETPTAMAPEKNTGPQTASLTKAAHPLARETPPLIAPSSAVGSAKNQMTARIERSATAEPSIGVDRNSSPTILPRAHDAATARQQTSTQGLHPTPDQSPRAANRTNSTRDGPRITLTAPIPQTSPSAAPSPSLQMHWKQTATTPAIEPTLAERSAAEPLFATSRSETMLHQTQPQSTPRTDLPPQVVRQLADVVAHMPNRPVEITLSPEELGRVRLTLRVTDTGVVVNLLADRPETLDLMRRNIDQLGHDFAALGYEDIAFSFAGSGADSEPMDHDTRAEEQLADLSPSSDELPAPVEITLTPQASSGLDLRL